MGRRLTHRRQPATGAAGPFDPLYRHVQALALRYGTLHRGAFLFNYVLGASAVTCALLALADRARALHWAIAEVAILMLVLLNFWMSRSFEWLRHFRDYRFLTEALRQVRVLYPVGMVPPTARPVIVHSTGHPQNTWMDRRFRGWVREVGPAGGVLDTPAWLQILSAKWIEGQRAYHDDRQAKLEGAERLLHCLAYACFGLAFLGCAGHLVNYVAPEWAFAHWLEERSLWLTLLAAGMPAWGATFHASSVQGEFLRLIERSEEMVKQLQKANAELAVLQQCAPVPLDGLRDLTVRLAQLMLDEVTDWRIVHQGPEFIPA